MEPLGKPLNEKPRKLTEDEIQDILSVVPNIKSPADTVSDDNTKSMKVLFREQLQDIEITPLGISELKEEIVRQFQFSVIQPGTTVGITAAESAGRMTTQSALNSFHSSGSSKNVSGGVKRIEELINASKEPKKPSCTMFFKNEYLSFDDIIIKKRPQITEVNVGNLVLGNPDIENYKDIVEPDWYDIYKILVRKDFKSNFVLRLDIDVNMLYAYKLTMQDVSSAIEQDGSVIAVYSPMSVGKIDIYPVESLISSRLSEKGIVSLENSSLVFLSTIVIPHLDQLKISGVSGIKQIYPVEAPVWQIVKEEQKSKNNTWFLILNTVRMKITGIGVDRLVKLCEISGIKVNKVRENYIAVESETSPSKVVRDLIEKDNQEEKEYEKKRKEEKLPPREVTDINLYSKIVYADSTGSNLTDLLSNPDIDSTRTFSNNVHEIREALGIEAARSFLIKEFIDVFGTEGYINPRHVVLLVDYMTSLGLVYGVTFTGVSRQPIGSLEKASYEKAMDVFKEAASFGEQKSVSGVSASVFIGKKALIGTGYSEDYIKPENLERYNETRKQLLEDPNMTLDANSFNDAIEQFNLGGAEDLAFLESAEELMFAPSKPKDFKQTEVAEMPVSEENIMLKSEVTTGIELKQAAEELEQEMLSQVTCAKIKVPETVISSGGVVKETVKLPSLVPMPPVSAIKPKPRPQPVKIFSLEEFLK